MQSTYVTALNELDNKNSFLFIPSDKVDCGDVQCI